MLILMPPEAIELQNLQYLIYDTVDRFGASTPGVVEMPADLSAKTWVERAPWMKYPNVLQFIGIDSLTNDAVGFVRINLQMTRDAMLSGNYNISHSIGRSFRNRGYGSAQFAKALQVLRCHGFDSALVSVKADNVPSISIIAQAGGVLEYSRYPVQVFRIALV